MVTTLDSSDSTQPSAWQLRFGRKKQEGKTTSRTEHKSPISPCPESPSIADQLLQALNDRQQKHSQPEQQLSLECADALLGKRNAFVPDLRSGTNLFSSNHSAEANECAATVRKLVTTRLKVDNQADALRRNAMTRSETRSKKTTTDRNGITNNRNEITGSERLKVLRERQEAYERKYEADERKQQLEAKSIKVTTKKQEFQIQPETKQCSSHDSAHSKKKAPLVAHANPLAQMEERQERLRQRKEARIMNKQAVPRSTLVAGSKNSGESNQEHGRIGRKEVVVTVSQHEKRRLEEQIARLDRENQHAIVMEEKLRKKQQALNIQRQIFSEWRRHVDQQNQSEARANAFFQWRTLQLIWTHWRQFSVDIKRERIAEATRVRLLQQKQLEKQAEEIYRRKHLPKWFYQWTLYVEARKERQKMDEAMLRRKRQAQRLMERLIRSQTNSETSSPKQQSDECDDKETKAFTHHSQSTQSAASGKERRRIPNVSARKTAWSAKQSKQVVTNETSSDKIEATNVDNNASLDTVEAITAEIEVYNGKDSKKTSPFSPPIDPLYRSMQERAAERKRHREVLKQKYEQLERAKREELEKQLVEREALLLQQKEEERQRIRERKRTEQQLAREKQLRLELLERQWRLARQHNQKRLLAHYGFRPWQEHHERAQRIAQNADTWYQLRMLHMHWIQWQQYHTQCQLERQRIEDEKCTFARRHHAFVLRRSAFLGWKQLHQQVADIALTVNHQTKWNVLQRHWKQWHWALVTLLANNREREQVAKAKLTKARLKRILLQWQEVTQEWKRERQYQHEKDQLWAKVRGWLNE